MGTAQMNMRIDAGLKTTGDLALRENGSTPTEIVRMTWKYLARNRHQPETIRKLFQLLHGDEKTNGRAPEEEGVADQVMRGPRIVEAYCREAGIDISNMPAISYDELRESAFDEKLGEMGVA